ncbi:AlpA family transcriptional regulator [Nitrosomonas sp. Nm58]|uniref:helix-turn-helix transcriptional regulator n=1 Tax=Nitrosomonas sp. Nm58 TaxID=200126 RepID=UPI000897AD2F|nr:AlpA family phage regulatory protein [Nitrosomonas sp. Nm58]SDZ15556.1 Predicted DNA-binding transcriptional regulator AlpA [Nitrosomonas sp. Nm58]
MKTNQAVNDLSSEKLLPLDEVERRTGFKSSFIYKQIKNKAFPPPVKIGSSSRWRESEIQSWIGAQIKRLAAASEQTEKSHQNAGGL